MGAVEILEVLRKNGELTSIEIADLTEGSPHGVKQALKRLLKDVSENLEFRPLTTEEKEKRYGHNLGCKIHIYWLNE